MPELLNDRFLGLTAESLNGVEALREASQNRLRALTRSEVDKDGEVRGLGLTILDKRVLQAAEIVEDMLALEHRTVLMLQKSMKANPLNSWVSRQKGVGLKQGARLLASLGDPYWNTLHNRPRTVSELWAYCGYSVVGGAAQRRSKGVKSNWSPDAKMRVFLVAVSCMKKKDGHYGKIYDSAREQYAESTHTSDCVRCGPTGHPAKAGTPLSAGHQHARALRRVSKEILKDIWVEAKNFHESSTETTCHAMPIGRPSQ